MTKPLTVWTNASLPDSVMTSLRERLALYRLIVPANVPTTNLVSGGPDPQQVIDLPKLN